MVRNFISVRYVFICRVNFLCLLYLILEIVFTRAAPAFDNLFMGCVFNINTVHKTVEINVSSILLK